jgi:formylglycine-generating enzyme required for sulfatase activity
MDKAELDAVLLKLVKGLESLLSETRAEVAEEWLASFGDRFVEIEGGAFVVGDNELHEELHALREKELEVGTFRLGRYVITQSEWKKLMNTQPWANEGNVRYGDDVPAVNVTWGDAIRFAGKINRIDSRFIYRLPTEAEWEYAARGGLACLGKPRTRFSFGNNESQLVEYGWHDKNASLIGDNYAHAVGQLRANPLGLFDMHGNIWEWTSEADGGARVVRGGGFNFEAKGAASAFRLALNPQTKGPALGFRLVQEPKYR